ncbi:MAG TPA: sugar transferase [Alphaproteobacteria bacterium]|jgi:Undecaprenyl-phosphate galactose phosphotransferase WbaP|nr:sugar transferase [Alphaproteobacteria bacterium]HRK96849.1 sugar transferase [Alphaproteobacteria bacterium]
MPYQLLSRSDLSVKNILLLPLWLASAMIFLDVVIFSSAKFLAEELYVFIRTDIIPSDLVGLSHYRPHPNLHLVLGFVVALILWSRGLYTNRTPWWSQVRIITKIMIFAFIVHGFLSFSLHVYESRLFIFLYWIFVYAALLLSRASLYKIAQKFKSSWFVPTVVIGDAATAEDLLFAFASDIGTGYRTETIFIRSSAEDFEFDLSDMPFPTDHITVVYNPDALESFVKDNPEKFYVVSLDAFRDTAREAVLQVLTDAQTLYSIVPSLSRANLYQMEPKYFFGHDVVMLHIRSSAPDVLSFSLSMVVKRSVDILASGIALLLVGPVIGILGACLKIEGQGGSIFYGGKRIGKKGQLFHCWKLRSMEPDSDHLLQNYLAANPDLQQDWETYRKLPRDPRVTTKTARLIRKLSLDELPQLWNIFVGDMSLVGPRPILPDETGYFNENTLKDYLSIRPGLTGLWQVSGRNKTSFKRRVYWDSWYVRNWSLWGDFIILIKTPLVLLTRKGAS